MAWSRTRGAKPYWFTLLQDLASESDDNKSIDLTHTDDESESDWSVHSSDEEFLDDSEVVRPG
jgi:hypothetical protein